MSKFLTTILVLLFLASLGGGGYLYLAKIHNADTIATSEKQLKSYQDKLVGYQSAKNTQSKQRAQQILEVARKHEIPWAQMLEKTLKYEGTNIRFENFAAGKEQSVLVNGRAKNLTAVARLIEDLKRDSHMEEPFVRGVSEGRVTVNEPLAFTFTLSFRFVDPRES